MPGFHDLLWNPAFLVPASQLLGGPVHFWQDQLFCKPAPALLEPRGPAARGVSLESFFPFDNRTTARLPSRLFLAHPCSGAMTSRSSCG